MAEKTKLKTTIFTLFMVAQLSSLCNADNLRPCWAHSLNENKSTLCMCTADYCDELTREEPSFGSYLAYTSSEDGLRFQKSEGILYPFYFYKEDMSCIPDCNPALFIDTSRLYQTVEGFGGATTDATGINWLSMEHSALRQHFIDSYFSKQGLEYNMIRVPIGGSDFSTHAYAYNELPENDLELSNYTLSPEDYQYKLPMIKACMEAATEEVHIVATTWSPPAWMKTNNALAGPSELKEEYYQTYADYHLKFFELYAKEGVSIWGVTTTNEPTNGILSDWVDFNSLGWPVIKQGNWILNNFGPTLRNSTFKDIKILAMDDQRHYIANYLYLLGKYLNPAVLDYIDGVALHFYLDHIVPPGVLTNTMANFPDKFLISTEACAGAFDSLFVDLGSWARAQLYINDIIEDLNHNVTGWIDWNMCLNEQGGPNWANGGVDSPIIVADDRMKFYKQPMYYGLAHFTKFIPRGSRRIHVETLCKNTVDNVSFLTPNNTIVTVLHNTGEATTVYLFTCERLATVELERNSVTTVEFIHELCHPR